MELFTLGIGNFTETDVKEAARALTGWTVEDAGFRDATAKHDDGEKLVLGRSGRWGTSDLLSILLGQRSTAKTIARRICGLLMGEGADVERATAALAGEMTASGPQYRPGGRGGAPLEARFDASNLGSRVVGPVEFVIGACRALVSGPATPSTLLLADWTTRLGQALFEPPNVGGWPGGRAWLTARAVVGRANFAAALVDGRAVGLPASLDVGAIAAEQGLEKSARAVREAASALLLGIARRDRRGSGGADDSPEAARNALATMLASPEAQTG